MPIKTIHQKSQNLTLLYVEDDPLLGRINAELFNDIFKSVDVAKNGEEGLEKFRERKHDLVITDINMPVMNGIEMVREVRRIRKEQPVMILTAYREIEYLSQVRELGIRHFLTKPIDMKRFTNALLDLLHETCDDQIIA